MSTRSAYTGPIRKLVLAFDVGTTYSGISYCILDPGQVPEIRGVTRFPAQELVGGDSKIPTIIYYDEGGSVKAVGAEAMREGIEDMAEDEGWIKSEWFKLHLRPKSQIGSTVNKNIPPLPVNKDIIDVFADFLRYMYECARTYIQDTHAGGIELWHSVEGSLIDFVLTHPNGWEGSQQSQMRQAAVRAGLILDTVEGRSRVTFVTEGEASLHFCIQSGLSTEAMKNGDGILIVDAGGGTIDISAYGQTSRDTFSFEEIASSECHFQGSVFVTQNAQTFLEGLLRGSRFFEDVPHIKRCFDKTTKLGFRNSNEPQYIKFGSARDRDPKLGIRSGQLKLSGQDVAFFFEPSVKCIVQAILRQRTLGHKDISSVFLVGGFAASDWLFAKVKESLEPLGIKFCRPDSHINKAVADGAISFYVDHFVRVRVSKFVYGTPCTTVYDAANPAHVYRESTSYVDVDGLKKVPTAFDIILPKNTPVSETKEFRRSYHRLSATREFSNLSDRVESYRGDNVEPRWRDYEQSMFSTLCIIESDLSHISKAERSGSKNQRRVAYYRIDYDIILQFGLTELQAQICWEEEGVEKRTPAKIIYEHEA